MPAGYSVKCPVIYEIFLDPHVSAINAVFLAAGLVGLLSNVGMRGELRSLRGVKSVEPKVTIGLIYEIFYDDLMTKIIL